MSWTGALAAAEGSDTGDRLAQDRHDGRVREPLRVIMGPTGAGKSALALRLAEREGLAVISADSRTVYRGFDIGTAKPTTNERAAVPHYGIDVADPEHRYSASEWANSAVQWMNSAWDAGTPPVVVGGTGFYVRALVQPLAPTPSLPREARDAVARWMDAQPLVELERFCRRLDPSRAALGRTQLARAVETALLAGVRLGDVLAQHEAHARALDNVESASPESATGLSRAGSPLRAVRYLVIDPGPVLGDRIRNRVSSMLTAGWVEEVQQLMKVVSPSAPAWLASGYRVIRQHVAGELTLGEARERVIIETRQYAKRQRTWCRHQLNDGPVTHLSPDDPRAMERATDWWHGSDSDVPDDAESTQ